MTTGTPLPPPGQPIDPLAKSKEDVLRTELREIRDQMKAKAKGTAIAAGILGLLLLVVLIIAIQNASVSSQTRELATNNKALVESIRDCTVAGGKCYQESRARSRSNIALIIAGSKAAEHCQREAGPRTTQEELYTCIDEEVARLMKVNPTPSPSPTR